jgi:hypothetical protein
MATSGVISGDEDTNSQVLQLGFETATEPSETEIPRSNDHVHRSWNCRNLGGCIQMFPDWPPGARTANDTALCH